MPETPRDYEAEFLAIMNALAESVAEASDEDLLTEAREMGEDPRATAARVRDVLKQGAKDYAQRRLREAEKAHRESVESIRGRQHILPRTPESRRGFFERIMTQKPELQSLLVTFQNRELRNFTDADIQRCLEHLGALGVLSEFEILEEQ